MESGIQESEYVSVSPNPPFRDYDSFDMEFEGFMNKRPCEEHSSPEQSNKKARNVAKDLDKSMLNALHHHELISETQQSEIELSRIIRTKKVDPVEPKKIKNYDLNSNIANSNRDSNQEEYHKHLNR